MLLLLRRCCVVLPLPPRRSPFSPPLFALPATALMPPRKRAVPAASASSGSDYEASPAPKKKTKALNASKKAPAAAKKAKSPVADGPKGLAPGWVKHGDYVIAK